MANRLAEQTSPYLLQHAENPVDWHPWGEEALALAAREDRPILLSIGYSACHWCHVMERESFEDEDTAAVMNRAFVNIKVDREERPDIDGIYMKAVQAMTGQGGWPLTAFLTPSGVPYYGGTYFPPAPRHGMPSFRQVLDAAANAYHERRDQVDEAGQRLRTALDRSAREAHDSGSGSETFSPRTVDHVVAFARRSYDPRWGGFGGAPKFPQPVLLEVLLRSGDGDEASSGVGMAVHTLERMARGGMRDQLGGGFHRYSVDERWLVPHFEKMLYDNALLARSYGDAAILVGHEGLGRVATEVLDDVIRDLGAPDGAFHSARDADSEGEEGTFYLWTPAQIDAVLDAPEAALFRRCYDVSPGGNFEGRSILHLPHDLDAVARSESISLEELEALLADARGLLREARSEREAPLLDDKILTSWNGMTIRALAEVGASQSRPDLVDRATRAAGFLGEAVSRGDDRLYHVFAGGRAYVEGFLEDYGALGNGLVSLYEATLDPRWLDEAQRLARSMRADFWSEEEGIFYDTAKGGEALLVRPRDIMDNATPSGNSLAVELLARLSAVTGDTDAEEVANRVLDRELGVIRRFPTAATRLVVAGLRARSPKLEVTLAGSPGQVGAMLATAHHHFDPNRVIQGGDPSDPRVAELPGMEGRASPIPRAYVCRGSTCLEPVATPAALAEKLETA